MRDNPDHHDAELLLRLYDLRREEKLRRAREWFAREFQAENLEDFQRRYPAGSEENAYFRMTVGYWDMAASLVNHGLIHEELFFENTGEFWFVWEKMQHLVPAQRERLKSPHVFSNLQRLVTRYEEWMKSRAPESLEARRQMLKKAAPVKPGASAGS
jgi:hypothetical protein